MQEIKPHSPTSEIDDFSFASLNPDAASPISAEDAFLNGQIRSIFNQPPIITNVQTSASGRSRVVSPAPELGKKSHSTGFSKLWRFGADKNKIRRSSSDGNDAFLFLRSDSSGSGGGGGGENKMKKNRKETASYNHERLYRAAENEKSKRKSYLPYRSNLMAFFNTPHF